MSMEDAVCTIHRDDNDDVFVLVDGVKLAKRGGPDTALAMTWIMLEPGWIVRDIDTGRSRSGSRAHGFTNAPNGDAPGSRPALNKTNSRDWCA
jgi:hypothetical protein